MSISYFIWCPEDTIEVSDKFEGRTYRRVIQNSVGPTMHINQCLYKGCMCERLIDRLIELEGEDKRNENN